MLRRSKENEHSTSVAGHATVCPSFGLLRDKRRGTGKLIEMLTTATGVLSKKRERRDAVLMSWENLSTQNVPKWTIPWPIGCMYPYPKKIQLPSHSVFLGYSDVSDSYLEIFTAQKSPVQIPWRLQYYKLLAFIIEFFTLIVVILTYLFTNELFSCVTSGKLLNLSIFFAVKYKLYQLLRAVRIKWENS